MAEASTGRRVRGSEGMGVAEKRSDLLQRWIRIVRARPRLFLAILLGLGVTVLLPADWRGVTRALAGWDVALGIYLVLAVRLVSGCDADHIRLRAALQDEGRFTILVLVVASALASLVAIVAELSGANRQPAQLVLAGVTILLSWTFMHTIFALHYAHEYYGEGTGDKAAGKTADKAAGKTAGKIPGKIAGKIAGKTAKGSGLSFPGEDTPDYWDFVYFSFVIGMTSQVSDVAVSSRPLRRLVAIHGVVSFIFNVTLLALMVNIAASAI
jgi:uncharacterized membrane protein